MSKSLAAVRVRVLREKSLQNATPIKGTLQEAFERAAVAGPEGVDFRLRDPSRSLGRYRSGIGRPTPAFYREKKEPLIG